MKKFVSAIAALAVVGAMAVPAMAATKEDVIAAVESISAGTHNASAYTSQVSTYLDAVNFSSAELDVVKAQIQAVGAEVAKGKENMANVLKTADAAVDTIANLNETSKKTGLDFRFTDMTNGKWNVAMVSNVPGAMVIVGVNTNDGTVGNAYQTENPGNPGAGSSGVIKATGANMNMTAVVGAALAMVASMGTAVVYGVKKGLLAK